MVSRGKLLLKKNSLSQPNCHSFRCPYLCTCIIKWFMATCLHFILVTWTTILVPFFVGLDFFYTTDFFAGWLVLRSCLAREGWWQGEDIRFIHWGFFFILFYDLSLRLKIQFFSLLFCQGFSVSASHFLKASVIQWGIRL